MSENAKRRSEARNRRRSAARDRTSGEANEQAHDEDDVHQAVRAAAAAAAVGAAVGAARALAARTDGRGAEAHEHEDSAERDDTVEPATPSQEHADPDSDSDQEPEPEPERERPERRPRPRSRQTEATRVRAEPRQGASTGTVRSIADRAREELRQLHGKDPESVTSLERIGDGWRITFEVLEVERIPSSTDVLATYVVELDDDARLLSFERLRRYARAQADRGDGR